MKLKFKFLLCVCLSIAANSSVASRLYAGVDYSARYARARPLVKEVLFSTQQHLMPHIGYQTKSQWGFELGAHLSQYKTKQQLNPDKVSRTFLTTDYTSDLKLSSRLQGAYLALTGYHKFTRNWEIEGSTVVTSWALQLKSNLDSVSFNAKKSVALGFRLGLQRNFGNHVAAKMRVHYDCTSRVQVNITNKDNSLKIYPLKDSFAISIGLQFRI